jgi:hypothetical protein
MLGVVNKEQYLRNDLFITNRRLALRPMKQMSTLADISYLNYSNGLMFQYLWSSRSAVLEFPCAILTLQRVVLELHFDRELLCVLVSNVVTPGEIYTGSQ